MNRLFTYCKTKCNTLFAIVLVAFSVVGCTEKDVSIDPPVVGPTVAIPPVTLETHKDFNPRKNVEVNIDYSGAGCAKSLFLVYAENPLEVVDGRLTERKDLTALAVGFTDEEGKYNDIATLPLDVEVVYIYSPDFGVPKLYKTNVIGNAIRAEIDFENAIDLSDMLAEVETKASVEMRKGANDLPISNKLYNKLDRNGRPDNIVSKMDIDWRMKWAMERTLPERGYAPATLISDNADITLYENASNVWISYFGGEGDYQSGFAYFCYPERATKDQIKRAAENAYLIFPSAHGKALGAYSGVTVKLEYIGEDGKLRKGESFPKGTRIGFILFANSWANNRYATYYSTKNLNKDGRSHTAMFTIKNNKGESIRVISMEDGNDSDYNDVAFVITSDPEKAIELPPAPDPDDTDRTHSQEYKGLLAFEDNWPDGGDYDMNDVVVKYNSTVTFNEKNLVTQVVDKFTLSWSGANYSNGFGYQVPFDLTKDVDVQFLGEKAEGVVASDVILLTKDVKGSLGVPGVGANDMPDEVTPSTYTVVTTFATPQELSSKIVPPYNPFIKKAGSNTEVHLVDFKPTSLADNTWPQEGSMDIADGKKTFFVSKEGYPFAFHLDARKHADAMHIDLRHEGEAIDKTYPDFVKWATNGRPNDIKWW